jgi:hypothetical protein
MGSSMRHAIAVAVALGVGAGPAVATLVPPAIARFDAQTSFGQVKLAHPALPLDAGAVAALPTLTAREGESVLLGDGLGVLSLPLAVTVSVLGEPPGQGAARDFTPVFTGAPPRLTWSWSAPREGGVLRFSETWPDGPAEGYARLVVIPLPRSTPAECARWSDLAAAAQTRARTAYRVARTTRTALTRRRAYRVVRAALSSRDGYLRLRVDGRCPSGLLR